MSIVSTSPACALPGAIHKPGLPAWKVTVAAARTAAPDATPVEASTPLGTSTLTTGRPRRVHGLDRLAHRATGLTLKARAEQRVHDHRRLRERPLGSLAILGQLQRRLAGQSLQVHARVAGEVAGRRRAHHGHAPGRLAQQARDHQPVSAVVALPAHHRHRPIRGQSLHHPRHPRPGALHQVERGHPAHLDRPAVDRAHRLGVEQRGQPVGESVHDQRC